ncbi:MAG: hypothetical protein KF749_12630 [Bacteroidetes bacterium]|nr:hypothetical protein [Bacteroidota bacterium]MCW5897114.1 hypothetical protein [Bacteroidota bacterium]
MQQLRSFLIAGFTLIFISSCAALREGGREQDYSSDMAKLQRQLIVNPNDPAALRDLGVVYFQTNRYEPAKSYLSRSYYQVKDDPRTMFYYGMTLEYLEDLQGALSVYISYSEVPAISQYRKLIEGRYRSLTQELIRRQFKQLVADEQRLGTEKIAPRAVAVFPLTYQGTDPRYEALGKGLSEMILIDLGQVKSLQMVERIRIEALLEELQFAQSASVDRSSAPRMGKLLSAGRIVSGSFNVNNFNLRMDVAAWDIVAQKFPGFQSGSDELDKLFRIQKELVFGIIRELGITLTVEEREKIQLVPTRNTFAFLTYCLALKSEDARDFRAAKVLYNEAAALDPGFNLAKSKAEAMEALSIAGGPKEDALLAAEELELGPKKAKKKTNLVLDRLRHLGQGIGGTFNSGEDNRKSVEEAGRNGAGVGRLPEPPPPPGR